MILTLFTEGYFDAAHSIPNHKGKCSSIHGHTWHVQVWVQGDSSLRDSNGILWDFGNLKVILATLDHKNINEVMTTIPTAENLVLHIHSILKESHPHLLFRLRVHESIAPKRSYCEGGDVFAI